MNDEPTIEEMRIVWEAHKKRKSYMAAYFQRPEVKAKQAAYSQRPEVKAKQAAYSQRPEVKAKKAARRVEGQIERAEAKLARLRAQK